MPPTREPIAMTPDVEADIPGLPIRPIDVAAMPVDELHGHPMARALMPAIRVDGCAAVSDTGNFRPFVDYALFNRSFANQAFKPAVCLICKNQKPCNTGENDFCKVAAGLIAVLQNFSYSSPYHCSRREGRIG